MKTVKNEEITIDVDTDQSPEALQAIRRVRETIHSIRTAMLTTTDGRGHLRSRPMTAQQSEADDELWFYTDARSGIIDDITAWNQVNVTFLDSSGKRFISASGIAHVVRDQNLLDRFWNRRAAEWFPDGPDHDPHLALLRVQLEEATCWDIGAKSVIKLHGMARSHEQDVPVGRPAAGHPANELPSRESG